MDEVKGKRIFVGLSGGVDSAVSAALLQRAGARVTGVFIKGWYPEGMPCTWATDRRDAMRVAARLQIPFQTLDASDEYKKSVIDYLIAEYRSGRTPNPDIMCNKEVKFGAFYNSAMSSGADAIATGHYISGEKDQRYFLSAVPKNILDATIFPVGKMDKREVRVLAKKFNLPVAEKKDSQGVCFLGSISVEEFLKNEFGELRGRALDEHGVLVGEHAGVLLYTLGERVPLHNAVAQGPWFVLAKNVEKNELTVGRSRVPSVEHARRTVTFKEENWFLADGPPGSPREVEAQYRYRGARVAGKVFSTEFTPDEPLRDIPTPGQVIVFYTKDDVLAGSGIIIR